MEKNELKENMFDSIKHIDENENEYWMARELQPILEYKQWRRFESVIRDAIIACKASNYNVIDHFANVGKMIEIAKGGMRDVLKTNNITMESIANKTHYDVGRNVRNAIKDIGGTMPKDLPKPNKSLKELEKEQEKLLTK